MQETQNDKLAPERDTHAQAMTHNPPNAPRVRGSMKLISWTEIWDSLREARMRGNGEMIEVFYLTLFKEAVFDDIGAWSMDLKKPS